MMKKLMQAAAIIALLTGTAGAQFMPSFPIGGDKKPMTPEEIEKQKSIDQAYSSATKKIPDKKKADDPWGTIRSAPAAQR